MSAPAMHPEELARLQREGMAARIGLRSDAVITEALLTIAGPTPGEERVMSGIVVEDIPGLAIHCETFAAAPSFPTDDYTITHLASGYAVAKNLPLGCVGRVLMKIAPLADWTAGREAMTAHVGLGQKVRDVVGKVLDQHYEWQFTGMGDLPEEDDR